jgi:hypothetical protein
MLVIGIHFESGSSFSRTIIPADVLNGKGVSKTKQFRNMANALSEAAEGVQFDQYLFIENDKVVEVFDDENVDE